MTEAISAGSWIQSVAVVGTGVIGASWAAYFLFHGLNVAATDPTPQGKKTLYNLIERVWPDMAGIGLAPGASLDRLSFTSDLSEALQGAEWVQENGPERIDVKRKLFAEMDRLTPQTSFCRPVPPDCS
jgi:carnitine 3-dehydrogenase